jgi:copper chaperone CopZ
MEETMEKTITIDGMSCQHCVMHVTRALKDLGLEVVSVEIGKAVVQPHAQVSDQAIIDAIEEAGYTVTAL